MPKLTMVIGGNGAGKSTWCSRHKERLPVPFYNADSIANGLGDWNNPKLQQQAREYVDAEIEKQLKEKRDFGFESTYSGKSRPAIVERAARQGYEVDAIFVGTAHPDINIERVAKRSRTNTGHDVPTTEIVRRWTAAQENLAATARHMTVIEVIDNSGQKSRQIASLTRNSSTSTNRKPPEWARKLTAQILKDEPLLAGPGDPAHRQNPSRSNLHYS